VFDKFGPIVLVGFGVEEGFEVLKQGVDYRLKVIS
jgi:hypothetical protein